jgi:hypothetical protein
MYVWLFCAGLLIGKAHLALTDRRLLKAMLEIPDSWLCAAFYAWLGFKLYLISMYGVKAFTTYRALAGAEEIMFRFAWWETGLEHYLSFFAVGACVVYVAKTVLIPNYWRKMQVLFPLVAFGIPYIVALESPIGSRRLIFMFALVGILLGLMLGKYSLMRLSLRRALGLVCLAGFVFGASMYYQSVRQNYFKPEIAEKLMSENSMVIVQGAALALLPNLERNETPGLEPASQLRDGPFELVYDIVAFLEDGHAGTRGEITVASIAALIPRVVIGEGKTVTNADEIISERTGITPRGEFLVLDLPTSVLAILLADFGPLGVVLAPMVVLFGFATMFSILRLRAMSSAPWLLLWCTTLLYMAAGAEADLVSILSSLRDVFIIVPVAVLASSSSRLSVHLFRLAMPKRQQV